MEITSLLVIGAAAALGATALASPAAAAATADTTGPTLSVAAREAQFPLGTTVENEVFDTLANGYTRLHLLLQWSARDPSGICGYDVYSQPRGDERVPVLRDTTDTSFLAPIDDYDGSQGGGSQTTASYLVVAHDCAGNSTTREVGSQPVVIQENGTHKTPEISSRPTGLKVSYTGSWTRQTGAAYSAGAQRVTRTAGSAVTFTGTLVAGSQFAIVSSSFLATVYVDGVQVGGSQPPTSPRSIVFSRKLGAGAHTVRVVAGPSPLAIDAFIVS